MFLLITFILLHLGINLYIVQRPKLRTNLKALIFGGILNVIAAITVPFLMGYYLWSTSTDLVYGPIYSSEEVLNMPLTARILGLFLLSTWLPYIYFRYLCLSFLRDVSQHYRNKKRAVESQKKKNELPDQGPVAQPNYSKPRKKSRRRRSDP